MTKKRIQVYVDEEIKRRVELAASHLTATAVRQLDTPTQGTVKRQQSAFT